MLRTAAVLQRKNRTDSDITWKALASQLTLRTVPKSERLLDTLNEMFPADVIQVEDGMPAAHGSPGTEPEWMLELRQELRLRGFSPKTQKAYTGHGRRLARHFSKVPACITETEIRAYLSFLLGLRQNLWVL